MEDRKPKQNFTHELEGTRRRGRPKEGWKEEERRDLQVLGVRRWRELVVDRKKMEGYCSTGQSPQWAVVPMKEEELTFTIRPIVCRKQITGPIIKLTVVMRQLLRLVCGDDSLIALSQGNCYI